MDLNGIHEESGRKEIICADCGHRYLLAVHARSGTCSACGNPSFLGAGEALLPAKAGPAAQDPLLSFRKAPDGQLVEEIRQRFQVEWQLWAHLVQHFGDPAAHMAYFCQAIAAGELEKAAERYREHRSVMLLLKDSHWQAELSDLMLARIEAVSLARIPLYKRDWSFDLPAWLMVLPYHSNLVRVAWVAAGLFFTAKLLRLYPY